MTTQTIEERGLDRDGAIREIRTALKRRSGKTWSVTGGRGTAWGWITIDAPPARRTSHCVKRAGVLTDNPGDYEEIETGVPGGSMTVAERAELGTLLGLDRPVHCQGESIPAGTDYRLEYIDRANGRTPTTHGKQYWD